MRFAMCGRNSEKSPKILKSQDRSWDMVILGASDALWAARDASRGSTLRHGKSQKTRTRCNGSFNRTLLFNERTVMKQRRSSLLLTKPSVSKHWTREYLPRPSPKNGQLGVTAGWTARPCYIRMLFKPQCLFYKQNQ